MNREIRHIVALSGGKDSTAMALRLKELHPDVLYEYICTPTGNEMPEMFEHWRKLGQLLGRKIHPVTGGQSLQGAIKRKAMLPNPRARWCTRLIKIEPYQAFLASAAPATSYVGIRADEAGDREGVDHSAIPGITNHYPMVEWGWGIEDVFKYLDSLGVTVPVRTDCAACFFQRLGEWWRMWKDHPDLYAEAEGLEEIVSEARGKQHTLRSDSRDSWPAALKDLRKSFELGKVPKGADQTEFALNSMAGRAAMCSFCAR